MASTMSRAKLIRRRRRLCNNQPGRRFSEAAAVTTLRYEVAGTTRTQSAANERRALRQLGPPAGPLHGEWECADTIGTVPLPWAGHFQC